MRQQVADPCPGLSRLMEPEFAATTEAFLAGRHPRQALSLADGVWKFLPVELFQPRLVIEEFEMRRPPRLKRQQLTASQGPESASSAKRSWHQSHVSISLPAPPYQWLQPIRVTTCDDSRPVVRRGSVIAGPLSFCLRCSSPVLLRIQQRRQQQPSFLGQLSESRSRRPAPCCSGQVFILQGGPDAREPHQPGAALTDTGKMPS